MPSILVYFLIQWEDDKGIVFHIIHKIIYTFDRYTNGFIVAPFVKHQ